MSQGLSRVGLLMATCLHRRILRRSIKCFALQLVPMFGITHPMQFAVKYLHATCAMNRRFTGHGRLPMVLKLVEWAIPLFVSVLLIQVVSDMLYMRATESRPALNDRYNERPRLPIHVIDRDAKAGSIIT